MIAIYANKGKTAQILAYLQEKNLKSEKLPLILRFS